MMYRCRAVKPKETTWREVEADSPAAAANEYHEQHGQFSDFRVTDDRIENDKQQIGFLRVEVEGHDAWMSRMFYKGIWRKGGVKPYGHKSFAERLKDAAKAVEWERDPQELAANNWDLEEESWH